MTAFKKLTNVANKCVEYLLIGMIHSLGKRSIKFTEHWIELYALKGIFHVISKAVTCVIFYIYNVYKRILFAPLFVHANIQHAFTATYQLWYAIYVITMNHAPN